MNIEYAEPPEVGDGQDDGKDIEYDLDEPIEDDEADGR